MIRNTALDPRERPHEWSLEADDEALARAPDIGRAFFARLAVAYPRTAGALAFLRWSTQADDVYAVYDADDGFGVQIDPHLDYIIIWNGETQGEYAEWQPGDDPVADALEHISHRMGPPAR